MKVQAEGNRQTCFYCMRQNYDEWERRNEAFPFLHLDQEEQTQTEPSSLKIGELDQD